MRRLDEDRAHREIEAVVFDLDGVLIESEHLWDRARRDVAREWGGHWREEATRKMQGMSSSEWSRYMRDDLGVNASVDCITDAVVQDLLARYREKLPLLPGAIEAVHRLAAHWPLGVASSANRVVIDHVVSMAGLDGMFQATVSSEEVPRGKPAPDVYLEAARRLGVTAARCAAIEDSANGMRSALAAGMRVIAIPNRDFAPPQDVLDAVDTVIGGLDELTPELVAGR